MTLRSRVSAPPTARDTIAGRYRVDGVLGQGGMGTVFSVVDLGSNKPLALKRLSTSASSSSVALFEREYYTLASLRHPGIVEVYEYGKDENGVYYTMERVDGEDLRRSAPMPWRSACQCLRDIASSLGVLHARALVHRDLSPRNFLRSSDGQTKLIDFGALVPFGVCTDVVGTAPFVAPEAFYSRALDQRTDIFGLGALAYWMLTGANAYQAAGLSELESAWQREPTPPSEIVRWSGANAQDPLPKALDELIESMLRHDPDGRLGNCSEVIERLTAIAKLDSAPELASAKGYLDSRAYVGRGPEQATALALLREAQSGGMRSLLVEGDAGSGRTRFLREVSLLSYVAGAVPIVAAPGAAPRPFGLATSLLRELEGVLPAPMQLAMSECSVLGPYLAASPTRLSVPTHAVPQAPAQSRLVAEACEVVLKVARGNTLVLVVDDVEKADHESLAILTGLTRQDDQCKLMLVMSVGATEGSGTSSAVDKLREQSRELALGPLSRGETLDLLRSVFGETRYLERLSERLYAASAGNPAHCLDIAQHLVRIGAIWYQSGVWILPTELPPELLPQSPVELHLAGLARLSDDALTLAKRLSASHDLYGSLELCCALAERPLLETRALMTELEREGVVRTVADGFSFRHQEIRAALYAQLDPSTRRSAHELFGSTIATRSDLAAVDRLLAAFHFMRAESWKRGRGILKSVLDNYDYGDLGRLRLDAPVLELIYTELRENDPDDPNVARVLSLLAISGFIVRRSYGVRYGDEALQAHRRVLRLALAERLTAVVGKRMALMFALSLAALSLMLRWGRAPTLIQSVRDILAAAAALAGAAATSFDPRGVERCATAIEPLTALGAYHAATVTREMISNLLVALHGRPTEAYRLTQALVTKLDGKVEALPADVAQEYMAGALTTLGTMAVWLEDERCLHIATRLERINPSNAMNAMNAEQARAYYYGTRGDMVRAQASFARMEVHAVQLGSSWQVEAWAAGPAMMLAMRLGSSLMMKRAVQDLEKLVRTIPSMASHLLQARGMHQLLRRNFEQAVAILTRQCEEPAVAWTIARGALAEAYNALGRHADAKAVCLDVLSRAEPGDLAFVALTLNVEIQAALADAGLAELSAAEQRLDALLELHTPTGGPLTMGALQRARCRVALVRGDHELARSHLAQLEIYYGPTRVPALLDQIAALRLGVSRAGRSDVPSAVGSLLEHDEEHLIARVQLLLSAVKSRPLRERAEKCLLIARELTEADDGLIVLVESDAEPVWDASHGEPNRELVKWAKQMLASDGDDERTVTSRGLLVMPEASSLLVGKTRFFSTVLEARRNGARQAIALVALGFDGGGRRSLHVGAVQLIARSLANDDASCE